METNQDFMYHRFEFARVLRGAGRARARRSVRVRAYCLRAAPRDFRESVFFDRLAVINGGARSRTTFFLFSHVRDEGRCVLSGNSEHVVIKHFGIFSPAQPSRRIPTCDVYTCRATRRELRSTTVWTRGFLTFSTSRTPLTFKI